MYLRKVPWLRLLFETSPSPMLLFSTLCGDGACFQSQLSTMEEVVLRGRVANVTHGYLRVLHIKRELGKLILARHCRIVDRWAGSQNRKIPKRQKSGKA